MSGRARSEWLSRPVRKFVLLCHVTVSVGALGVYLGLLALAVTGLTTENRDTLNGAYLAMGIVADTLIIPISIIIVLTGIILGLGTRWGLLRHYWVVAKLALTLGLAAASIFGLRTRIHAAIANLPTGESAIDGVGSEALWLVLLLPIALMIYTANTVLAIYKPGGMTRRARNASTTGRATRNE